MWFFAFFILPFVGIGYALWHIWQLLPLTTAMRWAVMVVALVPFACLFLVLHKDIERMPLTVASVVYEVGTSSIMVLLYLVMTFIVLDIGRLVGIVPQSWLFANGHTALGLLLLMVAVFGYGRWHYGQKVRVNLPLTTKKEVAQGKDSLKIVMLSDLHLGYHNRRTTLRQWIDLVNQDHPDLVLIAGDIIDISVWPLIEDQMASEFHRLKAPVYACLGNHEYYSGTPMAQQFYSDAGIHLLRDSVTRLGHLCIIGRDDRSNPHRKRLIDLVNAAHINPDADYTIVLDHQPYHLEKAQKCGIDLQLSGHTHRGQVWPISWITDAIYEQSHGPLRKGHTDYYVSSGMGIWGGKFRIGTQSEYVVITITQQ